MSVIGVDGDGIGGKKLGGVPESLSTGGPNQQISRAGAAGRSASVRVGGGEARTGAVEPLYLSKTRSPGRAYKKNIPPSGESKIAHFSRRPTCWFAGEENARDNHIITHIAYKYRD